MRAPISQLVLFLAALVAAAAWTPVAAAGPGDPGYSAIPFAFNGTTIAAGRTVWFNSALKLNGPAPAGDIVINFTDQKITIGTSTMNLPDSRVTYTTSVTTATTSFNSGLNRWETILPKNLSSANSFLGGYAYLVPSPFKGDSTTNPVTWSGTLASPTSTVNINWQWGAAVYTSFPTSYGSLGVKPTDNNTLSGYQNSDRSGTPESYKSPQPVGGATGGGGSNFTGSYSGTAGVTPARMNAPVMSTVAKLTGNGYVGASTIGDTATLSGGSTSPPATGTITFNVYGPNDANCTSAPLSTSSVRVAGDGAYPSGTSSPTTAGKYRFIASYTGDAYNAPITTGCADMNDNTTVNADTKAPLCTLFATNPGPPKVVDVMVQDSESGLIAIAHHETNAAVAAPTLTGPTTSAVTIRATKINQSQSANFGLTVKDAAGNTTVCDPVLRVEKQAKRHARSSAERPARATGLTLRGDASRLAFGSGIELTGSVPSGKAGEVVSVLVRPCGFDGLAQLATVRTGAKGAFRYAVHPTLESTFAVAWNDVTSKSIRVAVQPQLTLTRLAGGRYRVDATTTNPVFLAGAPVLLQKASGTGWTTIARGVLVRNSPETGVTVVSSATFKTGPGAGRLRAVLAGTGCYAPGASAPIGS